MHTQQPPGSPAHILSTSDTTQAPPHLHIRIPSSNTYPYPPLPTPYPQHLHPSLGVPVAERTYAADCRLLHPSASSAVRAVVVDVFVLAHTLGWWGKALLLRHRGMLWAASILFEVLESSLNVRGKRTRHPHPPHSPLPTPHYPLPVQPHFTPLFILSLLTLLCQCRFNPSLPAPLPPFLRPSAPLAPPPQLHRVLVGPVGLRRAHLQPRRDRSRRARALTREETEDTEEARRSTD